MRALIAFVLLACGVCVAAAQWTGPQPRLRTTPLALVTAGGEHRFTVELALSDEEKSRGLMFRERMAPDEGMLFDFGRDAPVAMWMQNTILPLDMVFIRSNGTVARVAENTTPFSTETIPSREPVRYVLELNAGTARRIGLARGDRVRHVLLGDAP
jgi:uncharacterized protein